MSAYCVDCKEADTIIVLGDDGISLFNTFPKLHPKLSIRTVVFADIVPSWERYHLSYAKFMKRPEAKYSYQALKKLYGCLSSTRTYCWVLDSEGLFIRRTSIQEIVGGFLADPYIVHSTQFSHVGNRKALEGSKRLLGYENQHWDWLLESYLWVWKVDAVKAMERIITARFPNLLNAPSHVFPEMAYNMFVLNNSPAFGTFGALNVKGLFGKHYAPFLRKTNGLGLIEDARAVLKKSDLNDAVVYSKIYADNNFQVFKPNPLISAGELEFLRSTACVKLLVSSGTSLKVSFD